MNDIPWNYGIIRQNVLMTEMSKGKIQYQRTALLGTIVKIEAVLSNKRLSVRFLKDDGETWHSNTFCITKDEVVPVREKLWPFLSAIPSPIEKVKLAENRLRCDKLMRLSTEMTVGFSDMKDVYLGTVKFIGDVKGMGKCVGLQLHKKKENNRCTGACAGIQYFTCLPGHGLFTTIDRIIPYSSLSDSKTAELDNNVSRVSINIKDNPSREEITTKYLEYPKRQSEVPGGFVRNSVSLQNIMDSTDTLNTNNDFDQNTIIQPDDLYLVKGVQQKTTTKLILPVNKNKSEQDLIDAIGGSWAGTTDPKQLESFGNLRKNIEKCDVHSDKNGRASYTNTIKTTRNRNANPISHFIEGSKTLPRRSKLLAETVNGKDNRHTTTYEGDLKLNEKLETLAPSNAVPSTSTRPQEQVTYYEPPPGTTNDLSVGSLVEVLNDVSEEPLYGVIRWMGVESPSKYVLVGVELENELQHLPLTLTDGTHNGERMFACSGKRALFVPLSQCHKDSRFQDGTPTPVLQFPEKVFEKECPVIPGAVAPLCMPTEEDVEAVCGKLRGIQGHHNSCYLDVTLFAMFTYTAVFDSLLFRPKGQNDIAHYEEVQRVLREEIVNPLRKNLFVSADRVMNLRRLLDQLSSVSGLTSEEKDPEEFLHSLLAQILKAEPFLKLSSGQEAYHYQLFVEKDDGLTLPSVQQLFEQSFLTSNIKLTEVPSCLIIQMPRFGKSYKMYPRILPSQLLDVTDVIENSPRQCTVCGKLAKWECRECFGECGVGLESTAFCTKCIEKAHSHERRNSHSPRPLSVPHEFSIMEDHSSPPRLYMELFAVICIETSHYVAFVKCGVGHEAPWCFFDSMADRKGEKNGYNIPEMVACPDVSKWLSDEQSCRKLHENSPMDRYLPEHARRLLCDAYICMYQSPDVMMYR